MPELAQANLIRNGQLEVNACRLFECDASKNPVFPPDEANWMIRLELWLETRKALKGRKHQVALLLSSDTDYANFSIAGECILDPQRIALIAIDFPVYTDGRGFSLAQILRNQYGWTGELRAVGDVMIDTVNYLARCGFDSFLIKEGHDPRLALMALHTFTFHYQQAYAQPNLSKPLR